MIKVHQDEQNFRRHTLILDKVAAGEKVNPEGLRVVARESAEAFREIESFLNMIAFDGGNPLCEMARELLETSGLEFDR